MRDQRVRRLSRFHKTLFRMTGGVLGRRLVNNDMLLLTTVGRKTGKSHTVPLLYLQDGERLVVIASFGGRPNHPAWYLNLVANPVVRVRTASGSAEMLASTAPAGERALWWPRIESAYEGYATYQARTDREIPVVFLDPIDR